MERWQLDLEQVRKNWATLPDASSRVTAEKAAPPAAPAPAVAGAAVPAEAIDKLCPACGAELKRPVSQADALASLAAGPASPGVAAYGGAGGGGAGGSSRVDPLRPTLPTRFVGIEVPRDPYPDARALLGRVRTLVHRQLPAHEPILAHFFEATSQIIEQLAAPPVEGQKPPDKKKLRAELDKAIGDLEDMMALWSGVGR